MGAIPLDYPTLHALHSGQPRMFVEPKYGRRANACQGLQSCYKHEKVRPLATNMAARPGRQLLLASCYNTSCWACPAQPAAVSQEFIRLNCAARRPDLPPLPHTAAAHLQDGSMYCMPRSTRMVLTNGSCACHAPVTAVYRWVLWAFACQSLQCCHHLCGRWPLAGRACNAMPPQIAHALRAVGRTAAAAYSTRLHVAFASIKLPTVQGHTTDKARSGDIR